MQDLVINRFSDPDQATDRLRPSDNPYAAPTDNRRGWWDKTLLRRVVRACLFLLAWFVLMDVVIFYQFFRSQDVGDFCRTLYVFFTNWSFSPPA